MGAAANEAAAEEPESNEESAKYAEKPRVGQGDAEGDDAVDVSDKGTTAEADKAAVTDGKQGVVDKPRDSREHLNLVFIGHVDAGKSTFCGQILYQTDQVDSRTIEKYEKEAKEKNRDSWFLAFIMDTN